MRTTKLIIFCIGWIFLLNQCGSDQNKKREDQVIKNTPVKIEENNANQKKSESDSSEVKEVKEKIEDSIVLNDQNAIPFFFQYQKQNKKIEIRNF